MSRKTKITTLFVAVATAAVFTSSASGMARMDNGAYGNGGVAGEAALDTSNIPYLSRVGTTRVAPQASQGFGGHDQAGPQPDLRRDPVPSHGVGITREVPTQATPIVRDTADGATLQRGHDRGLRRVVEPRRLERSRHRLRLRAPARGPRRGEPADAPAADAQDPVALIQSCGKAPRSAGRLFVGRVFTA